MTLINQDVQWSDTDTGRTKRGFVTRMIGQKYEIIGEDDNLHMVGIVFCESLDVVDARSHCGLDLCECGPDGRRTCRYWSANLIEGETL